MKTTAQIKDQIARENGYRDFDDVIMKRDESYFVHEIAIRYAEQAIREAAEMASVKCENALKYPGSKLKQTAQVYSVDKQSILNIINDLK